ncbi:hypothetical protein LSAT2_022027 [Lamellibrachia satsuma]|nr:hypothetical protein LSAT2_022027 [Lamellibrachia satsuma]
MIVVAYANPSVLDRDGGTTVTPTSDPGSKGDSSGQGVTSGQGGSKVANSGTPAPGGRSDQGGPSGGGSDRNGGAQAWKSTSNAAPEKIYLFGIGRDWKPYEYIDEDTGDARGLHKDVVNAVCDNMKKRCDFYMSDYKSMWDASRGYSQGLWDNWYDGSLSWAQTPDRMRSYAFLGDMFRVHTYGLFATQASGITTVDPETHKVGFRKSWAASPQCLKRERNLDVKTTTMYDDFAALKTALKNTQVDVALLELPVPTATSEGIRQIGDAISCTRGGYSLMVRKDSRADMAWFEEGMNAFVKTNQYTNLCFNAKKIHGGDPRCITS